MGCVGRVLVDGFECVPSLGRGGFECFLRVLFLVIPSTSQIYHSEAMQRQGPTFPAHEKSHDPQPQEREGGREGEVNMGTECWGGGGGLPNLHFKVYGNQSENAPHVTE